MRHDVSVRVSVTTRGGTALYRTTFDESLGVHSSPNPMQVAQENFALLNESLLFRVEARLEHNRLVSKGILGSYVLAALLELVCHYRSAGKGRLYFRKSLDRRLEVLAVGTKNTQERELEFLASL